MVSDTDLARISRTHQRIHFLPAALVTEKIGRTVTRLNGSRWNSEIVLICIVFLKNLNNFPIKCF